MSEIFTTQITNYGNVNYKEQKQTSGNRKCRARPSERTYHNKGKGEDMWCTVTLPKVRRNDKDHIRALPVQDAFYVGLYQYM